MATGAPARHHPRPVQPSSRNKIVAGFVSVAGVIVIWLVASARQNEQTEALSRQWVGEQWDVARNCLLGTPIGRGEDEETIRALLDRQLVLAMASAVTEPDRDRLWPARCAPLFEQLRVDRSILRGDPGDAPSTLEVLAPRVLEGTPLVTRQARARAHELAEAIARLDAVMPSGAEYDPREYAHDEGMPAAAMLGSLECPPIRAARRPLLDARAGGDVLYDELALGDRSLRLSGAAGAFSLSVASPSGTESRALAREGATHPLLWDERSILWVSPTSLSVRDLDADTDAASTAVDGPPIDRAALCRTARGAHLVARRGDALAWIAWPDPIAAARAPVAIDARPTEGAFLACSDDAMLLAGPDDEGWRSVLCEDGRCEAAPLLAAGGDLQLAMGDHPLAVARGPRSDLPVARALRRDEGALAWSDPVPVVRGLLSSAGGSFRLEACSGAGFTSEDGATWRAAPR